MQSAAAELAYLCAARAALEGGLFGAENAAGELKKRFEYSYSENGKPVLSDAFMSLSHTGGAAMAAVSPIAVGVDIEREKRVSLRTAKRIMGEREYSEFESLPGEEKRGRMLECWTAKESFLKLTGEGILAGLDKLYYDPKESEIRRAKTGERAYIARLDAASGIHDEIEEMMEKRLFACVCSMQRVDVELLRFSSANSAAEFISGEYPP